ncbi:MAG: ParB/RepB/Spo0J family partition protein [Deltaproteobacteria bacterium]|nr:ParB/RepB/Spo0J family partition protein [Deltaproteobacteria bacterium]
MSSVGAEKKSKHKPRKEDAQADYRVVPLGALRENPKNPRKTFDGLEELAASIGQMGQIVPGLARPHPTEPGALELVAGHRRFRACTSAGVSSFRVVVRDMDVRARRERPARGRPPARGGRELPAAARRAWPPCRPDCGRRRTLRRARLPAPQAHRADHRSPGAPAPREPPDPFGAPLRPRRREGAAPGAEGDSHPVRVPHRRGSRAQPSRDRPLHPAGVEEVDACTVGARPCRARFVGGLVPLLWEAHACAGAAVPDRRYRLTRRLPRRVLLGRQGNRASRQRSRSRVRKGAGRH